MTDQKKAYIYVLTAVLLWSTVASAFKLALREINVIQVLFLATIVSFITLLVILTVQRKWYLFILQNKKDILKSALLGLLNPFLYYLILFRAYDLLPGQEAQPLNYTWAIVLAILSIPILKQRISIISFIAILISFFGVFVISVRGDFSSLSFTNTEGVILAVGSSLIWATYWLLNVKDKRDPIVKLFTVFIFGSIYITITLFFTDNFLISNLKGISASIYIGLFEMGITFVLWLKALSLAENKGTIGNFIYLSPFLSLVFLHFIVGENIYFSSIIGLILIIGGVLLQEFARKKKKKNN